MTEIDPAVVEKVLGPLPAPITNPEAWPPGYADGWNEVVSLTTEFMPAALHAINLPDLLRKEREYDALLARVEVAPVGRRYEIAVGDWIVTPDEWAEIDMPCKRVRLLVEQEG